MKATTRRIKKTPRIPKGLRVDVTRAEFNRVIDLLNQRGEILNDLAHNQHVQLMRIAQLQAELDLIKRRIGGRDSRSSHRHRVTARL